ncbi:hypothetical protein L1049_006072 [Liquidambar formosana]|uniref:SP-RING-type domain-containing protein n=1 Tax=Liquidambar formosana TaxID=63359 RepID=A0AAP0RGR3_LIQFO
MTGATATPPPPGFISGVDMFAGQTPSASSANSHRIACVTERLDMVLHSGQKNLALEIFNPILSLARGIDYAVANNEVPVKAQELPLLVKQICQRKNDYVLQVAIMVLMISVKNACKFGWFSVKDTEELLTLANEMGSRFCSPGDINPEPNNFLPTISKVMARFYPRMKIGQILASLEVKPGYGAYLVDFHISKNASFSPQEKIHLFVAQTDNIETSSCIISPPQVNFLLNGRGVEKRTNLYMEGGPQFPTIVAGLLKYGTNLLQVVGQFNGHYIIAIAFMSVTSSPDSSVLQDYVQPAVAALDSDSEIIEGPSRISINCPISYSRIKTPVKGHSCKHLQCFDFDNFMEINSRWPSWRCPHCNQSVCFSDICVDQNMVKVLREVGENVADVIITADGSWKAVLESDDHGDQPHDDTINSQQEGSEQRESTGIPNGLPNVFDLTEGDDEMDEVVIRDTEDRKPFQANPLSHSVATNLTMPSQLINSSDVEDDFWSGIFLSTYGSVTSGARSDAQIVGGISEPSPSNNMITPVLTDAVSPAFDREPEVLRGTNLTTSLAQSQFPAPNSLQLQQSQLGHTIVSNEYGRLPSIPRHVSRTPIAIQALPAQSLTPGPQQRSRTSLNSLMPNGSSVGSQASPSLAPTADSFNTISSDMERRQQFSRSLINPHPLSDMASSSLQHHSMIQNRDHQDHLFIPGQSVQQVGITAPSQLPGAYRLSSGLPSEHQNSHQQPLNLRMPQNMSQSPGMIRSSGHLPRTQIQQGGAQVGVGHAAGTGNSQHARTMVSAQRAAQVARQYQSSPVQVQTSRPGPSYPVVDDGFRSSVGEQRGNVGGMVQPAPRADGLGDLSSEQNWRPTGRMRGSLSGRAYSAALSQFMIQPTQPAQAARPLSMPPPCSVPPQLHVLLANSRNAHAPQAHNYPMTEPVNTTSVSGILPERSSGMQ